MGVLKLPSPKADAESMIREIAKNHTRQLAIMDHARLRMIERDVTDKQLFLCIIDGELIKGPTWDRKEEPGWKCTFKRHCSGASLRVGCKLVEREEGKVLVLTVFWRE